VRPLLLLCLGLYALAAPVVVTLYIIQEGITRQQHIAGVDRLANEPTRVRIRDADGVERQTTIRFVDSRLVGAHARMGNEIEEHLAIVLALNVLSSIVILVMGVALWRTMPPTGWRVRRSIRWLAEKSRGELPHGG
jgi:hypothetical protein